MPHNVIYIYLLVKDWPSFKKCDNQPRSPLLLPPCHCALFSAHTVHVGSQTHSALSLSYVIKGMLSNAPWLLLLLLAQQSYTHSCRGPLDLDGPCGPPGSDVSEVVFDFLSGVISRKRCKISPRSQLSLIGNHYDGFSIYADIGDLERPWKVKTHMQSPLTKK